ncbi:hypothetical protein [Limosilactobacillus fermentum]
MPNRSSSLADQQNEALLDDAGAANDLVDFQWRMLLVALGLGEQPAESGPVAHQIDQLANQAQETVVVETDQRRRRHRVHER